MEYSSIFKRTEMKYMLSADQCRKIRNLISDWMQVDKYGETTISNIYYDTPDSILVRRSIEKPVYKEKLRIRSYGVAKPDSPVFVELKKKFSGIVYKRRVAMTEAQALSYMNGGLAPSSGQIISEIDYFKSFYTGLRPAMYISYDRTAFFAKNGSDLRITFDRNITYRNWDLSLEKGSYGDSLLGSDQVLMEIKASEALPLWLVSILSANQIFKTSFSKYGNAYLNSVCKGARKYA